MDDFFKNINPASGHAENDPQRVNRFKLKHKGDKIRSFDPKILENRKKYTLLQIRVVPYIVAIKLAWS